MYSSIELCAGAGGQALGIEQAGFVHEALVEIDTHCCNTLRKNRPFWNVLDLDIKDFRPSPFKGIDLLAGGLPCPPFSVAGKQLGAKDERNLFPDAMHLADEIRPRAIMIENVRGFLDSIFEDYRFSIKMQLEKMGYTVGWRLLNASDYGVPQLRPRVVIVAVQSSISDLFDWPAPKKENPPTVGQALLDLMSQHGWRGAKKWAERANEVAPTIVGGSKKHGGPDLGPSRAKRAWAALGVDGHLIADAPPSKDFFGMPRLTVPMVARIQGFPDDWNFTGKKTPAYRQVGNAFPPPVAYAVADRIRKSLSENSKLKNFPIKKSA